MQSYNQGLTPLHPSQKSILQINMIIRAIFLVLAAVLLGYVLQSQLSISAAAFLVPAVILTLLILAFLPGRIYRRWGYDMEDEQLRVLRGYMWHTDTIVPFNRIQHIDVAQGPFQRIYNLSTLIVHTAGTHNSVVTLPGLHTPDAEAMRETIKGHIRQEMI